jgi:hypothetical protein
MTHLARLAILTPSSLAWGARSKAVALLALTTCSPSPAAGLPDQPLLQNSDFTYLGAFAMPQGQLGGSFFIYGGHALTPYHGRLIVAASEYYDADGSHVNTHGVSGFDLANGADFSGFYPFDAVASPRSLGGYMTTIPEEWQPVLGGPALSGQCCLSIIGNGFSGPAATVFDPDDVGVENPNSRHAKMTGAGYDALTSRLYIAQPYGDYPRIDVYEISVPVSVPPVLKAVPEPGGLRIEMAGAPGVACEIQVA